MSRQPRWGKWFPGETSISGAVEEEPGPLSFLQVSNLLLLHPQDAEPWSPVSVRGRVSSSQVCWHRSGTHASAPWCVSICCCSSQPACPGTRLSPCPPRLLEPSLHRKSCPLPATSALGSGAPLDAATEAQQNLLLSEPFRPPCLHLLQMHRLLLLL